MPKGKLEFSLEHLGLPARNPRRLKDWYVATLDAEVVFDNQQDPPTLFLRLPGGFHLEIYPADSALPETANNRLAGWRHLALRVKSISESKERLEEAGIRFTETPKPAAGGGQVLFFSDPEGNLLHLVERTSTSARRRYRAVIFDMDGVIVNSEPVHERAFREVFAQIGYAETHGVDFSYYYGRTDRVLWTDFIAKHNPPFTLEELTARKQERYLEIIKAESPIFADLPPLLSKLAGPYKLALASGSLHPVIDAILAMKDLRRFFPVVVSVQDVPRAKPAPDIFLQTALLLGLPPSDCCVIEDSIAGIEAALAAGMDVIGITNSFPKDKLTQATHVVSTYDEIERLLL